MVSDTLIFPQSILVLYKVLEVSAETGEGIDKLNALLDGKITLLSGNSGVGKSSLLNLLLGENVIATGEVSEKLGRGRHTTRHTEIYSLPFGGFVADTPGFSSLELDNNDYELKENLSSLFRDFEPFLGNCKFTSCTHTKENGCGVINAVKNGAN